MDQRKDMGGLPGDVRGGGEGLQGVGVNVIGRSVSKVFSFYYGWL